MFSINMNYYHQWKLMKGIPLILTPSPLPRGSHFHIASDMDVRRFRVRFLALKSAKGVLCMIKTFRGG